MTPSPRLDRPSHRLPVLLRIALTLLVALLALAIGAAAAALRC
jgi:hypothetical protein